MSEQDTLSLIVRNQENQDRRLERIESALITLTRVEERQASQRETLARYGRRLDEHDERLNVLERTTGSRGIFFRWLERLGLVGAGGVITKLISAWPWGNHP